jgi:hypothetical protein
MKRRTTIAMAVLAVLLAGAGYELWHTLFHKVWRGQVHFSEAQRKNPMLAATRLLEARGHQVRVEPMLDYQLLNKLPDGVLLLSPYARQPDERQARLLLDWVRRGNTLVMTPGWVQNSDDQAARPEAISEQLADPLGKHFGVAMSGRRHIDESCRLDPLEARHRANQARLRAERIRQGQEAGDGQEPAVPPARLVCLTAPGSAHPIELRRQSNALQRIDSAGPVPLWSDTLGLAVQAYAEGRGRVAMVASDTVESYFDNSALRQFDHGELLVLLAEQGGARAPVLLVQHNDTVSWTAWLWQHGRPVLLGLAALLLLWAWNASRRFGPLLPEAAGARRALIEHIEASGRWLWQLPQGRALLLEAVRRRTLALLLRRLPELQALSGNERARRLARLTRLPEAHINDALHGKAAARAADFTRQISTLQQLRAHHER